MSQPTHLATATTLLLDCTVGATAVMAAGWTATRLLPRASAAQRHLLWVASFAALPSLPVVSVLNGRYPTWSSASLMAIWAVGFALTWLRIAFGWWALRQLRHAARPTNEAGVLESDGLNGPVTWGWIRPIIVMPSAAMTWTPQQRAAAMLHERAHIARRDWLVQIVVHTLSTALWFHPAVWWAKRQLMREAEHAADDRVLEEGVLPSDYAALLLSLARARHPTMALGAGSPVAERIRAVLDDRPRTRGVRPLVLLLGLLIASAPLAAVDRHVPSEDEVPEEPVCKDF